MKNEEQKKRCCWCCCQRRIKMKSKCIVRVRVFLLPFICDRSKRKIKSFFEKIVDKNDTNSIFANNMLRLVTQYKWNKAFFIVFSIDCIISCICLVIFLINYIYLFPYKLNSRANLDSYSYDSIILDGIILLFCLYNVYKTMRRLFSTQSEHSQKSLSVPQGGCCQYFWDSYNSLHQYFWDSYWNIIDFLLLGLLIIMSIFDIFITIDPDFDAERFKVYVCFTILIYWFRFMSFLRGFQGIAFMNRLIFRVFLDIRYFLLIVGLFIVGFSFAGYVLQIPSDFGDDREHIFLLFYRLTLGDFTYVDEYNPGNITVFWIVIIFSTVTLSIILLNLLISFLNDIYDKVRGSELIMRNCELMNIINDGEDKIYGRKTVPKVMRCEESGGWINYLYKKIIGDEPILGRYLIQIYNDSHIKKEEGDVTYERIRSIVEREEAEIKSISQSIDQFKKIFEEKLNEINMNLEKKYGNSKLKI